MSKKDSVDALAEIKIDPTSYQSESVPPSNDLRSLDKVEHVKCVVNAPRHSCEGVIMRLNKRKAWQRRLQIALLCVILAIFWGLSAIPIVSYHLSTEPAQSLASNSSVQLGSSADGSADAGRDSSVNCSTIRCSDGFYCTLDSTSNRNICRPRCDTWEENPEADVAFGAVSGIAAVIGLTTGVAALIIACIRRGKV